MPNPIIIIFEYHQVPAGEHLFQSNFTGLVHAGYKTYLDEEAFGTDLNKKQALMNASVINAQEIPDGSPEVWQKEIVTTRKKSVDLLVENQFDYHAYDLPEQEVQMHLLRNIDVLRSHPKGMVQGMNDLLSGKIPERKEAYELRVKFQNEEFTKQANQAEGKIICIAGIYHANHLQSYLRAKFPGQDVLSFFPYQGQSFEPFEEEARNPELNTSVFPHNSRLVNMDSEQERSKHIILDDLTVYNNLVNSLARTEQDLIQKDLSKDQLNSIQEDLKSLKKSFRSLKSLNNLEMYLFAIDVYLLKCAIEKRDLSYIKTNYTNIQKSAGHLPKTELKTKLISLVKEIVKKYQLELKVEKESQKATSNDPGFFAGKVADKTQDPTQQTTHKLDQ